MSQSWSSELWRLIVDTAIGWIIGLVLGIPLWGIIVGMLVYVFLLGKRLRRFEKWLNQSLHEPDEFGGIVEELAFRIYRIRLRSRKRKKRLTEFLRRWQDSAGALPDAAVVIDRDGDIAWFNQTASTMLGLKPSDQSRPIVNLLRNPRFIHFLKAGDFSHHLEIASPLDISKILSIRISPYGNGQLMMLVTDVTHIQRLMTMRRDFIANVSHELRTPLTVIMGYLETLKEDESCDPDTIKQYLGRIEAPALRMKTLVEDLLLLSRLDTGAPTGIQTSSVINMSALIKTMVTDAEQLSQGQHRIVVDVDEELQLKGIEKEIYSACINLVTNAVRYTPEGGEVIIQWLVYGDGARFCVRDNGPGISADHLPRLTERFYRVDVGRSRSSGGTGLGLAIVKQVLRRHDAELHVDSELGKGTEFCCFFPQARVVFSGQSMSTAG
ncbi:MAG: phosphate regulon sensor histidine kinase PhoR [Gammaproteobacteria bacterium]|nr:phosphate regulon sensor histidine kinase PhoR [Gammaproteobacteria bacterium]